MKSLDKIIHTSAHTAEEILEALVEHGDVSIHRVRERADQMTKAHNEADGKRGVAIDVLQVESGKPYGHVPGHKFEDVKIGLIETKRGFRAKIEVLRGSSRGYDQVHFQREVSGRGSEPLDALEEAVERARSTGDFPENYLIEAISKAEELLEDWEPA